MAQVHFTDETFRFLADLAANNDRDWFEANRDRYEAHWKAPAFAFIAAIRSRLASLDPPLHAEARLNASLRRINRDVRFSADKSPYSATLHMIFSTGGAFNRDAGMHIVLEPGGVGYGAGLYGLSPDLLERYRQKLTRHGEAGALVRAIERAATTGARLAAPDLARPPQGYPAEGQAADLLRHKSIVVRTAGSGAPPRVMTGRDAIDWTVSTTEAFLPLLAWLRQL
jgi:uncharacterized protein (TIGR02453 family)